MAIALGLAIYLVYLYAEAAAITKIGDSINYCYGRSKAHGRIQAIYEGITYFVGDCRIWMSTNIQY